MLVINPFLFAINGVPKNEFAIHPATGHELQFGHGDHTGDKEVDLFFWRFVLLALLTILRESSFEISFKIPHEDVSIFLPTVEHFINMIPSQTVNLARKVVLKHLLFVIRLRRKDKTILTVFPPTHIPITR